MPASVTIGLIYGKGFFELVSYAIFWANCRKEKSMQKLDAGENPLLVYLIMLAPTPVNQMEIVSPAEYRRQQRRNGTEPLILGAAIGMDEAKALAGEIVADVYRLTGTADVKGYYDDARVKRSKSRSCLHEKA